MENKILINEKPAQRKTRVIKSNLMKKEKRKSEKLIEKEVIDKMKVCQEERIE